MISNKSFLGKAVNKLISNVRAIFGRSERFGQGAQGNKKKNKNNNNKNKRELGLRVTRWDSSELRFVTEEHSFAS